MKRWLGWLAVLACKPADFYAVCIGFRCVYDAPRGHG